MVPQLGNAEQWLRAQALESDCRQLPDLLSNVFPWTNDFSSLSLSFFVCNMELAS